MIGCPSNDALNQPSELLGPAAAVATRAAGVCEPGRQPFSGRMERPRSVVILAYCTLRLCPSPSLGFLGVLRCAPEAEEWWEPSAGACCLASTLCLLAHRPWPAAGRIHRMFPCHVGGLCTTKNLIKSPIQTIGHEASPKQARESLLGLPHAWMAGSDSAGGRLECRVISRTRPAVSRAHFNWMWGAGVPASGRIGLMSDHHQPGASFHLQHSLKFKPVRGPDQIGYARLWS